MGRKFKSDLQRSEIIHCRATTRTIEVLENIQKLRNLKSLADTIEYLTAHDTTILQATSVSVPVPGKKDMINFPHKQLELPIPEDKRDPKKPYVTGLYGCSCHPFKDWAEHDRYKKQKFKIGQMVKHRCTMRIGKVNVATDKKGWTGVKYSKYASGNENDQAMNLILIEAKPTATLQKKKAAADRKAIPARWRDIPGIKQFNYSKKAKDGRHIFYGLDNVDKFCDTIFVRGWEDHMKEDSQPYWHDVPLSPAKYNSFKFDKNKLYWGKAVGISSINIYIEPR